MAALGRRGPRVRDDDPSTGGDPARRRRIQCGPSGGRRLRGRPPVVLGRAMAGLGDLGPPRHALGRLASGCCPVRIRWRAALDRGFADPRRRSGGVGGPAPVGRRRLPPVRRRPDRLVAAVPGICRIVRQRGSGTGRCSGAGRRRGRVSRARLGVRSAHVRRVGRWLGGRLAPRGGAGSPGGAAAFFRWPRCPRVVTDRGRAAVPERVRGGQPRWALGRGARLDGNRGAVGVRHRPGWR